MSVCVSLSAYMFLILSALTDEETEIPKCPVTHPRPRRQWAEHPDSLDPKPEVWEACCAARTACSRLGPMPRAVSTRRRFRKQPWDE